MKIIKLTAIISSCVLSLMGFCSCSSSDSDSVSKSSTTMPEAEKVTIDKGTMHGYTAAELISQMKTGWNLGNSLDSLGGGETAWGNPETTQQLVDIIRDGGFDIHMGRAYGGSTRLYDQSRFYGQSKRGR